MQRDVALVANGDEHRWWADLVPWFASALASMVTLLGGAVAWVIKDRWAIQQMLSDHDAKLTRLIEESDEWDGGHEHDRGIREVSAQVGTLAVEMRTDIRNLYDRLGWPRRN